MLGTLFFDKQDRELLRMINETIDHGPSQDLEHKVFDANLHPHGILELTTTHEYRMAHAVINLLGNLEAGGAPDRLMALRILRDEVLHSARTPFRYNTGRVLIQIMKEIIRSRQDELTQLKLVHDFRKVTSGNPRLVRQFLNTYHLLEMPEEWNQLTVDHHVHDANTKGRKNATHLIMDAWIKGIRYITVVYYNYVEPAAARELLQAAEIMGVDVRIGLEFRTPFRDRFVCFVWAPRGVSDPEAFLSFLAERPMVALMNEGRKASLWMQRHVMDTLQLWNAKHAPALAEELEIPVPLLEPEAFLAYVGTGQTSFLHLAEYAHKTLLKHLVQRVKALQEESLTATSERQSQIAQLIRRMDMLTTEVIMETWLKPERNPELPSPDVPDNAPDTPELLRMPPHVLLDWLSCLRSGYRITLQLAELTAEDVLELLWDCQGMITHLELFNLKEWQEGHLRHLTAINDLQIAINKGSVLHLKQILRGMIRTLEASSSEKDKERCAKFRIILRNIPSLQAPYKVAPLRIRIGTDSTSHSGVRHGMGLAMPETLPHGARRQIARGRQFRPIYLPVSLSLEFRETYAEQERYSSFMRWLGPRLRRIWGFGHFGLRCTKEWRAISGITQIGEEGNVITMGGIGGELNNGLRAERTEKTRPRWLGFSRLSTPISNTLKVLAGFIPALVTFLYTQEWWVLAWFGAPLWFLITGLRNIPQAILGGGGMWSRSLLRWNDYVSWTRVCDSLLYTGLSVPLLEYFIRVLLLEDGLGLTVKDHQFLVFSIIAGANSIYISLHNIYRGFPKEAIIGNLFRSLLAIPVSVFYNDVLALFLPFFTTADPLLILEPGAAIISKTASDTVAAIIEGLADWRNNRRLRYWDYETKLQRLFDCYAKLELAFPDQDILSLLSRPEEFTRLTSTEARSLQVESIINALDLMYFWLYQPCAQQTLTSILRTMTREERVIVARSQGILSRVREVSQLFVDGLLGRNFARALSFYLDSYENYILTLNKRCAGFSNGHRPLLRRRRHISDYL